MKVLQSIVLLAAVFSSPAFAKLNVVASIPDLAALASEVGGDSVSVESIAKGTQDPHFVEAKPSFMLKVSRADLLILAGLDLEVGWIPPLLKGARNTKVSKGAKGYLELGPQLEPLDVAQGSLTRADGDVHPDGNPHFWLDPIRLGKAAALIAARLGELDPSGKDKFEARAKAFADRITKKTAEWKSRLDKSGVTKVVTYHRTLTYFLDRFGIENSAYLEPKPGIPPTSGHIIEVIRVMKSKKVPLILVENYFDVSVTKKITGEVPGARAVSVPVAVGGAEKVTSGEELIEQLVRAIEGK